MRLVLIGVGLATALTAVVWLLVFGARWAIGGRRPRLVRPLLLWLSALIPLHALVTVPAALGWIGSHLIGTRGDERSYRGPAFAADGTWLEQERGRLAAAAPTPPARELRIVAADGVATRAFLVPAAAPRRGIGAVLVHGLFRGALELEPVGRMLRGLGCDVLLLELRNHGGSDRDTPSFGVRDAADVVAACRRLLAEPDCADDRVLLFGVSLGTVAVSLAAADAPRLSALVLDAPVRDLAATAHRMLGSDVANRPRRPGLPQPFRSLSLWFLERWTGIDLAAVRPIEALRRLDPSVRALVIGGGEDDRVLEEDVRAVFAAIPAAAESKELWIEPGAGHGDVWRVDPDGYRRRLERLIR